MLTPGSNCADLEGTGDTRESGDTGRTGDPHAHSLQILAALPVDWRGTHLLACSCLRVVFIPLFILCVYPSGAPALRHPAWPCVFSLLMGISNGYFGSVPMILAAGKVSPRQRELAGKAAVPRTAGKPRPGGATARQPRVHLGGHLSIVSFILGTAPGAGDRVSPHLWITVSR